MEPDLKIRMDALESRITEIEDTLLRVESTLQDVKDSLKDAPLVKALKDHIGDLRAAMETVGHIVGKRE